MASTTSASPFSLTAPFTRRTLNNIRSTLADHFATHDTEPQPGEPHAAVLAPFCNVNDRPGILLEVRGKLRTHSGEVSFPGGRVDETDSSTLAAALRETEEEIGLRPEQVEILGRFGPAEKSLGGLRVWPYVGFIYPETALPALTDTGTHATSPPSPREDAADRSDDAPLPNLALSDLKLSPKEVAHAFHLPLSALVSAPRLHQDLFRGGPPYFAIDVSDIVTAHDSGVVVSSDGPASWASDPTERDEIGGGKEDRLEVWGLTGWYLNVLLRILGVYTPLEAPSHRT